MFFLAMHSTRIVSIALGLGLKKDIILVTSWNDCPVDEFADATSIIFSGKNTDPKYRWGEKYLTGFTYDQLIVLAKECTNNPDLLQKVVEAYWEEYEHDLS